MPTAASRKQSNSEIRFPLSTSPGNRPEESEGRLINCFAEPLGEQTGNVYHRAPGCKGYGRTVLSSTWTYWSAAVPFLGAPQPVSLPTGLYRGGIFVNNTLFVVLGTGVYTIANGGFTSKIGVISGSDYVFFARNNQVPTPFIVAVCGAGSFNITTSNVTPYTDPSVGSPSCVEGFEGFIIFGYGNGNMLSTDINSPTINSLNLGQAQTNPNGILSMRYFQGSLYVFGDKAIEIWGYPINPSNFPLTRISYAITPGLINNHAVSGWEPEFGQSPIYVAADHTVRQLQGTSAQKISSPDLDRLIEQVADASPTPINTLIETCCYVSDGVPFWQVSSQVAPFWSWVYNCNTTTWHERQSYLLDRSRLTGSIFAYGLWLCGDLLEGGYMLQIDSLTFTEPGTRVDAQDDPLIPTIESLPTENFPNTVNCPRADFEFTPGQGIARGHDPDQTNPYAEISWSNDGGLNWSYPQLREIGRQGRTKNWVVIWRTGMTGPQGRRWRVRMPSNVDFGFIGATMQAIETINR